MSLVGPRPELPRYVESYTAQQRQVLSIRPGITDLASLAYRHEENLLAQSADPENFYQQEILPKKLELNLRYLERISLAGDVGLILKTLGAVFVPSKPRKSR